MSYNSKEDDVIIFDPFDDEDYAKWQALASQTAERSADPFAEETKVDKVLELLGEDAKLDMDLDLPDEEENTGIDEYLPDEDIRIDIGEDLFSEEIKGDKIEAVLSDETEEDVNKEQSEKQNVPADSDDEELKKQNRYRNIIEFLIYVIAALMIIYFVPRYVMERVSVEGDSMNRTLSSGDQLIGEKISVRNNALKRYDIIYFAPRGNRRSEDFIKRIIGLPGETVYIEDSVVYINGYPLQEDYAAEKDFLPLNAAEPVYLGADEYFVLGDNRNRSTDSRSPAVGKVHLSDIEGRAIFRLWPLSGFGRID